ncbi:MAG TPA: glycosyltransferase family 9 protein [Candidatus Binatia bacterium]
MKSTDIMLSPRNGERICVIFPGALGDFVCLLPALHALSQEVAVDLFARSEFAEIVPPTIRVRSIECSEISRLFAAGADRDDLVRCPFGEYRAVFSWLGSQQPSFVHNLKIASHDKAKIFPFRPDSQIEHQTDYYLRCLAQWVDLKCCSPQIVLRSESMRWCEDFWTAHSLQQRPVLTIAPGSGAREKNWPEERFHGVARWWQNLTGGSVIVLMGPVEVERGGFGLLQRECLTVSDLSLSHVAALLARGNVYLGNDSGVSHLAAAVGVRSVVLFGPADPRQWAPRGAKVTIVSRQIACSPCAVPIMKGCPHRACLTELNARDLIELMGHLPEVASLTRLGSGIRV